MNEKEIKMISIIIPCFNEEGNIIELYNRVCEFVPTKYQFEFIFVDDGSSDQSLQIIKKLNLEDSRVRFISFSRNFGHQNALKAGIDNATGDCSISLDADLQHPPSLIPRLLEEWEAGFDVVYTIRVETSNASMFKKATSNLFYRLMKSISHTQVVQGAADFRLLDKKVMRELSKFTENYLFIRGIIAWMGYRQKSLEYKAEERFSGKTKYPFRKMFKFAIVGVTSFSIKPLKISLVIGFIIAILSFLYGVFAVYATLFTNYTLSGWGSLVASVLFIGGIQLVLLGVMGEYLGKLFIENKKRPNYIIRDSNISNP
ncbi:MAG: glycosyltransferase family 2 protein [Bacteroidales bacterium]|nr:glycosyltransferase family 2 protein [Bacteroidales bacterium]